MKQRADRDEDEAKDHEVTNPRGKRGQSSIDERLDDSSQGCIAALLERGLDLPTANT